MEVWKNRANNLVFAISTCQKTGCEQGTYGLSNVTFLWEAEEKHQQENKRCFQQKPTT